MDPLPQYGSHAFIPYLSDPHPTSLAPLTLLNTSTWTYSGPLLAPTSRSLPPSFHTWCQTTISGPFLPRLLPFLRFLYAFLRDAGVSHYWLTIRASKPTAEYNTVRWHTDDIFFDDAGAQGRADDDVAGPNPNNTRVNKSTQRAYWKLAATLLGPATLFQTSNPRALAAQRAAQRAEAASRSPHTCTTMRCPTCLEAIEAVRHTMASALAPHATASPAYGSAAFFRLGPDHGAVHSEPACPTDRIFVNVVPGSEDELRALMARWGLGFPRSWCFGVPVVFGEGGGVGGEEGRVDCPVGGGDGGAVESGAVESGASTSTMSVNLGEEYTEWVNKKGFRFSQVFGGAGDE
ncbi:hypothetical protein BDV95DRAFT_668524 [Massariosphaeria phaeospora]|uniref:Uncharacterized protein n=1 Tax=Massariosphaeria phaeospora TaxID=100035 RepID=A0A7C8M7J9_9PLEO|nr:hypothetical protein BDV95DRAFT_668524 [Massariosphaeria phaeospora]